MGDDDVQAAAPADEEDGGATIWDASSIKCRNFPDDDDVTRNYKKDPHGIRSTAKSSSSMNRGKGDDTMV